MADPLSIIASTSGIIDVCVRITIYLRDVNAAAGKIDQDLAALRVEFTSLQAVNNAIHDTRLDHQKALVQTPAAEQPLIEKQWQGIEHALSCCSSTVLRLGILIEEVVGKDSNQISSKLEGIKKALRKQSKEKDVAEIRQQIMTHRDNLQVLLQALNLSYTRSSQTSIGRSLGDVSDEVTSQGFQLQRQIDMLLSRTAFMDSDLFRASIASASHAVSSVKLKKHFLVPRAVSSIYTGRAALLVSLKQALNVAEPSSQKRFVIYGMGGSGKTEFCCKFAQENRQSFWGVFWVDGPSEETMRYTYSNIAKVARLEPNDLAAKNWLANLVYPWLLLIDNADDRNVDLEQHFPAGESGFVLVTTRNPYYRTLGTLGDKCYDFEKETLGSEESNELLLKAADEPRRMLAVRDAAARIAHRLGYLPLALVQAGKAIFRGMCTCTLWNYLDIYDSSWQRIRRARSLSGVRGTLSNDEVANMKNVYASYEIIFRGLQNTPALSTRDAVDLFTMFSFFSNESLRMQVLIKAVRHPQRQQQYDEEQAAKLNTNTTSSSWAAKFKDGLIWIMRQMDKSAPVLPAVLREENFDEARLGDAMDQLVSLVLVHYQREDNSYSMHPLIHTWVRERPEMSNAQQALWCQVASSTLAQSILLPPLDIIETAEALRRHLLLHVRHVQKCRESIDAKLLANRASRRGYFWAPIASGLNRQLALEFGKFSLIYYSNGFYPEAKDLQLKVKDFVVSRLGMGHPLAWRVTLALSATYFALARTNKAAELQAQVLESCRRTLGPDDAQTLRYTDILGASRCFQGRFKESRQLHELAIEGMTRLLGENSEDTLIATDNLGKITWGYFEYETAHSLHLKAFEGLSKILGPTHELTLQAAECLALSCIDLPTLICAQPTK